MYPSCKVQTSRLVIVLAMDKYGNVTPYDQPDERIADFSVWVDLPEDYGHPSAQVALLAPINPHERAEHQLGAMGVLSVAVVSQTRGRENLALERVPKLRAAGPTMPTETDQPVPLTATAQPAGPAVRDMPLMGLRVGEDGTTRTVRGHTVWEGEAVGPGGGARTWAAIELARSAGLAVPTVERIAVTAYDDTDLRPLIDHIATLRLR